MPLIVHVGYVSAWAGYCIVCYRFSLLHIQYASVPVSAAWQLPVGLEVIVVYMTSIINWLKRVRNSNNINNTQVVQEVLWNVSVEHRDSMVNKDGTDYWSFCVDSDFCCLRFQDTFFYSLVYDPTQKTLLADKGEIRVGPRFQADVPDMMQEGK